MTFSIRRLVNCNIIISIQVLNELTLHLFFLGGRGGNTTHTVSISNGVKQGGVLSPVLFTAYMDELLVRLVKSRCGCYIGNISCSALSYADDVIILAPTTSSVFSILSICEKFANDYDVILMPVRVNY